MGFQIRILDEQFGKTKLSIFELDHPTETLTVRELITRRVEEEVARVNSTFADPKRIEPQHRMFLAGITGTSPEALLNGNSKSARRKPIDPRPAVKTALKAFEAGRYYILFNDQQVEHLEHQIKLTSKSQAVFLRLTPLVGG